ncbi:MAG: hypothetical protein ACK4M7_00930, partial [Burkholderiales bacterium]
MGIQNPQNVLDKAIFKELKAQEVRDYFVDTQNLEAHQQQILNYFKSNIIDSLRSAIDSSAGPKERQLTGLLQSFINLNLFATSLARKGYSLKEKVLFQDLVADFHAQLLSKSRELKVNLDIKPELLAKYILTLNTHVYKHQILRSIGRTASLGLIYPAVKLASKKDKLTWLSGAKQTTSLTKHFKQLLESLNSEPRDEINENKAHKKKLLVNIHKELFHSASLTADELAKRLLTHNLLLMAGCKRNPYLIHSQDFASKVTGIVSDALDSSSHEHDIDVLATLIGSNSELLANPVIVLKLLKHLKGMGEDTYKKNYPRGIAVDLVFKLRSENHLNLITSMGYSHETSRTTFYEELGHFYNKFANLSISKFKAYMQGRALPNLDALVCFLNTNNKEFRQFKLNNVSLIIGYLIKLFPRLSYHPEDTQQEIKDILNQLLHQALTTFKTASAILTNQQLFELLKHKIEQESDIEPKSRLIEPLNGQILQFFISKYKSNLTFNVEPTTTVTPTEFQHARIEAVTHFLKQIFLELDTQSRIHIAELKDEIYNLIANHTAMEDGLFVDLSVQQEFLKNLEAVVLSNYPDYPAKVAALEKAITAANMFSKGDYAGLNQLKHDYFKDGGEFLIELNTEGYLRIRVDKFSFNYQPARLLDQQIKGIFDNKLEPKVLNALLNQLTVSGLKQDVQLKPLGYEKKEYANLSRAEKELFHALLGLYQLFKLEGVVSKVSSTASHLPFWLNTIDFEAKYILPVILQDLSQVEIKITLAEQSSEASHIMVQKNLAADDKARILHQLSKLIASIDNEEEKDKLERLKSRFHEANDDFFTAKLVISQPDKECSLGCNIFSLSNLEYTSVPVEHPIKASEIEESTQGQPLTSEASTQVLDEIINQLLLETKPVEPANLDHCIPLSTATEEFAEEEKSGEDFQQYFENGALAAEEAIQQTPATLQQQSFLRLVNQLGMNLDFNLTSGDNLLSSARVKQIFSFIINHCSPEQASLLIQCLLELVEKDKNEEEEKEAEVGVTTIKLTCAEMAKELFWVTEEVTQQAITILQQKNFLHLVSELNINLDFDLAPGEALFDSTKAKQIFSFIIANYSLEESSLLIQQLFKQLEKGEDGVAVTSIDLLVTEITNNFLLELVTDQIAAIDSLNLAETLKTQRFKSQAVLGYEFNLFELRLKQYELNLGGQKPGFLGRAKNIFSRNKVSQPDPLTLNQLEELEDKVFKA